MGTLTILGIGAVIGIAIAVVVGFFWIRSGTRNTIGRHMW